MISLLSHEVARQSWMSPKEFTDVIAVSQITPGPIAVNLATFVGFRQAGILGAIFATAGVCLPSLMMVLVALQFLNKFKDSKIIQYIFFGLRPAVTGLIFVACMQIAMTEFFPSFSMEQFHLQSLASVEIMSVGIAVVAFAAMFWGKINPIFIIIASAIVGALIF